MTLSITTVRPVPPLAQDPSKALDEILAWAEAEAVKQAAGLPSEWDQGHWAVDPTIFNKYMSDADRIKVPVNCGTACCLAGRVVHQDGGLFLFDRSTGVAFDAEMTDGNVVDVETYAEERLGLTSSQAEALFWGGNKIEDVRRIVAQIKDGVLYPDYDEDGDGDV